jgi:hypothetical protein
MRDLENHPTRSMIKVSGTLQTAIFSRNPHHPVSRVSSTGMERNGFTPGTRANERMKRNAARSAPAANCY